MDQWEWAQEIHWIGDGSVMKGERGRRVKAIFKVYKWDEVILMPAIRNRGGKGL